MFFPLVLYNSGIIHRWFWFILFLFSLMLACRCVFSLFMAMEKTWKTSSKRVHTTAALESESRFIFLGQWSLIISQIIFFVILLVIAKAEEFNWNVVTFHVIISLFSRKERFLSQTRQNWTRQQRTFWWDFDALLSSLLVLVLWSKI